MKVRSCLLCEGRLIGTYVSNEANEEGGGGVQGVVNDIKRS